MPSYEGNSTADLTSFLASLPRSTQTLDLSGKKIGNAGAQALAEATHLSNLQSLDLQDNSIGEEGALALAQATHLTTLQSLDLGGNKIGVAGAQALASATHLSNLQFLDLGNNEIRNAGAQPLVKAIQFSTLEALVLEGNKIGDVSSKALAKATHLSNLQVLDLRNNYIGEVGTQALAKATHLSTLQILHLAFNKIGNTGVQALADATHLATLEVLSLSGNRIGDAGVQALAEATHLSTLQYLDLEYNQIGDAGAQALAKAAHLFTLQYLILGDNEIGDAGTQALAKASHLSNLQSLDLRHPEYSHQNNIGDAGARALAEATHLANLRSLDLKNNKIGDAGIRAILHHLLELNEFYFSSNNEISAPNEICGNLALLRQHYQIAEIEAQIPNTRIRAMLIGEPGVGKTTVYKRLLGEPIALGHEPRTLGVKKAILDFDNIHNKPRNLQLNFQLQLWDLGGQRLQHMLHGLFFQAQALYLLVLNQESTKQQNTISGVGHWLEMLVEQKLHDNAAAIEIIPVLNPHRALKGACEPQDTPWWHDYRDQLNFDKPVTVDLVVPAGGMDTLLARLREQLAVYPLRTYWQAIDEIAPHVRGLAAPYFHYGEFQRELKKLPAFISAYTRIQKALGASPNSNPLNEEGFAELVQAHLHQQGEVTDLRKLGMVIVDPGWVEKGLYSLLPPEDLLDQLTPQRKAFQEKIRGSRNRWSIPGVFTASDVAPYWKELGIPKAEHLDLMRVLRMRELGLVLSMGTHGGQEILCVPAYLDELPGDDEALFQAISAAYQRASYCSVFKAHRWPPYFIYRHMVSIRQDKPSRAVDGRDFRHEESTLYLDIETLAKRHYRVMDRHEKAAQIEIIFHDEKLWCFAHFEGDQDTSSYNLRHLMERLESSYGDVAPSLEGPNLRGFRHTIPCPGCMKRALAHPAEGFSQVEFIEITVIERSPEDKVIECAHHHLTRTKDIVEQLSKAMIVGTPKSQVKPAPTLEETRDAAINVSLFLHDLGMAKITGKLTKSVIAPLCGDGPPSLGVSISVGTWRDWLRRVWETEPNRASPLESTINSFVEHLVERFPIIRTWAEERETPADNKSERARLIVTAAQWVQTHPGEAVQRWLDANPKASCLSNKPISKNPGYAHATSAWLATYLNSRDAQK